MIETGEPEARDLAGGLKPSGSPIVATSLRHSFGRRVVLDDVSLDVPAGRSVAVMGRSGAGKTTLLSCLLGLITPRSGEVSLSGIDLRGLSRRRRAEVRAAHVGIIFQHGELVPELTAVENVALPALLSGHRKNALEKASELLEDLEVPLETFARDLSGGEVQRVGLARALINNPEIVIADEPTGSLDTELRERAADRLFGLVRDRGVALLLVTHDPALAARADQTFNLTDGKIA